MMDPVETVGQWTIVLVPLTPDKDWIDSMWVHAIWLTLERDYIDAFFAWVKGVP